MRLIKSIGHALLLTSFNVFVAYIALKVFDYAFAKGLIMVSIGMITSLVYSQSKE